jgi:hypothetical protein
MRDWSKNLRRRSKSRGISGSHWRRRSYSTSNFLGPGLISGLPLELLLVSNQPARLIMLRVMHDDCNRRGERPSSFTVLVILYNFVILCDTTKNAI